MAIKTPEKRKNGQGFRRPFFVARTVFDQPRDLPPDIGLDGSPYSADGLRVSEEEYWEKYYEVSDYHYEWNNGVLEEKPVSDFATVQVYKWLFLLVDMFLATNPIAKLIALETAFRLKFPGDDKVTIRKPDFFVVLNDNPANYKASDNSFPGIADLCVEALSHSSKKNLERDTKTKLAEYELIGVREFYMLHADSQNLKFYRRTKSGSYQEIPVGKDGIVRSEVLLGFQFRVSDLFRQPLPMEMAKDEVYRHFVLPEVSKMLEQAEQAHIQIARASQRAEQESQRAEEERARAERLAAKLRELGIDEDAA